MIIALAIYVLSISCTVHTVDSNKFVNKQFLLSRSRIPRKKYFLPDNMV
jgi:hypothetical protein